MNKMIKAGIPALAGALILTGLTGCAAAGNSSNTGSETTAAQTEASEKKDKIKIVTTIFPEYDWVKNILGEKADAAEVTLLCSNGTDMHSYQPSVEDIVKISESDVFIYGGGESEEWAVAALSNLTDKDIIKVNLIDELGSAAKKEELAEGMQEEHEEHGGEDHEHEGDAGYDEHVWLSLKNASVLTDSIAEALCEADSDNADIYRKNAQEYKASLNDLDAKYTTATQNATVKTLLFADRFPFRYMTDDYGLQYFAAFPGCSAETEASFETIAFLAEKTDELSLKHVMTIEGGDDSIAKTVISNTKEKNQDILEMNSIQSVTNEAIESGISYLGIMEENLQVLEKALN